MQLTACSKALGCYSGLARRALFHTFRTQHCKLQPFPPPCLFPHLRMRAQMEWNVPADTSAAWPPSTPFSRSFSSSAALLVKVMTRTLLAGTPSDSRRATRAVTTRVLPDPGPALTRTAEVLQYTAACCSSFKVARYSLTRSM